MKIYNTMTRQKEELVPLEPGVVKIYACGPTVYNFIHIGNARPLCVFDVLRRYLEWRGYEVRFVQNFTDIDDKIIRRANEEGVSYDVIAQRYIEEFWKDAKGLGVREATIHPKATENMEEILSLIGGLVEKGYAYRAANGDVYFRTRKDEHYGKLSHQPIDDLESGARIGIGEEKEDALDFALWKAAKPGEPSWPSPWGEGRPGWHIECSAMARRYLGETIDIHCGGQDLIFPHHENEVAQSECCNGVPFARYWMHNGYINVDNKKMSKSLGNFFTVRDVAEQMGYEPIRFFLISSSYRSPINYNAEIIGQGKAALDRLYTCRSALDDAEASAPGGGCRRGLCRQMRGTAGAVYRRDGRRPQHRRRHRRPVRADQGHQRPHCLRRALQRHLPGCTNLVRRAVRGAGAPLRSQGGGTRRRNRGFDRGPYRGAPKQELGRGRPDPGRTEGAENRAGGYPAGGQVA